MVTDWPRYLREVAMGLRTMGFPISAPSLEQLAAAWEAERNQAAADRAALERARALIPKWRKLATGDYAMAYIAGMSKALRLAADELEQALGGAR